MIATPDALPAKVIRALRQTTSGAGEPPSIFENLKLRNSCTTFHLGGKNLADLPLLKRSAMSQEIICAGVRICEGIVNLDRV